MEKYSIENSLLFQKLIVFNCDKLKVLTLKEVEVFHNSKQNLCILHCHQQYYQVPKQPLKNNKKYSLMIIF